MTSIRVYFKNSMLSTVDYEERVIPINDNVEMAKSVLEEFIIGPKSQNLVKTMPNDMMIINKTQIVNDVTQTIFEIEFSREYYNMTPIEESFFRASFVWTMTDLDFIDSVHIYVEGNEVLFSNAQPMGLQSRETIDINPRISPNKVTTREVVLYFTDETGTVLIPENRTIEVNPDLPIEQFVVQELINGPQLEGRFATVSPDVKIREVETENGICFVNLSMDFISKTPASNATDQISVYSIVNSLIELKVKKVQFLIESESVTQFKGAIDMSRQFEKEESLNLQ
ncbi:MAG: GerMN domain-containing protein [Clostridiales bacterium]|jgi:germination protein M|nr:GerMN domain-containing protein [Clostridiales bacterium]